jgi:hypothetical protein
MVETVIDPGAIRQFVRDLPDILSEGHRESPEGAQPREFERDAVAQRVFSDLAMAIGSFRDVPTRVLSRAVSAPREFARAADAIERDFRLQAGWVYWRRFLLAFGRALQSRGRFCASRGANVVRRLTETEVLSQVDDVRRLSEQSTSGVRRLYVDVIVNSGGMAANQGANEQFGVDLSIVQKLLTSEDNPHLLGRTQIASHLTGVGIRELLRKLETSTRGSVLRGYACSAMATAFIGLRDYGRAERAALEARARIHMPIVPHLLMIQILLVTSRFEAVDREVGLVENCLNERPDLRDTAIQFMLACSGVLSAVNVSRPKLVERIIGVLNR